MSETAIPFHRFLAVTTTTDPMNRPDIPEGDGTETRGCRGATTHGTPIAPVTGIAKLRSQFRSLRKGAP